MGLQNRLGHGDTGQITMLIIGFGIAIMLLIGVVVDASAAFIYQRTIRSLADGASLAATNGVNTDAIYENGSNGEIVLDAVLADQKIQKYVRDASKPNGGAKCRLKNAQQTRVTVECAGVALLPISSSIAAEVGKVDIKSTSTSQVMTN